MKKILLLAVLSVIGIQAYAQPKMLSFGLKGGLGLADQNYKTTDLQAGVAQPDLGSGKAKFVGNIGVYGEVTLPTTPLAVNVGAAYRTKGTKRTIDDPTIGSIDQEIKLSYLTLDAVLKLYLSKSIIAPYVGAGIRGDFKLSDAVEIASAGQTVSSSGNSAFKAATLSGVVVAGVQLWKLSAEVEWNPDLTYSNKSDAGSYSVSGKNSVIGLNVGFRIFGI